MLQRFPALLPHDSRHHLATHKPFLASAWADSRNRHSRMRRRCCFILGSTSERACARPGSCEVCRSQGLQQIIVATTMAIKNSLGELRQDLGSSFMGAIHDSLHCSCMLSRKFFICRVWTTSNWTDHINLPYTTDGAFFRGCSASSRTSPASFSPTSFSPTSFFGLISVEGADSVEGHHRRMEAVRGGN